MKNPIRKFQLTPLALERLQLMFKNLNIDFNQVRTLAQSIQKQSDFYIENPEAQTPWTEPFAQLAQVSYYFPLNFLRNLRAFEQISDVPFFDDIDHYIELGSGLSPSFTALQSVFPKQNFKKTFFIETSPWAQKFHQKTLLESSLEEKNLFQWLSKPEIPLAILQNSVLVCSYSLTEFTKLPAWIFDCKALIILEPSTRQDGQRLIAWRKEFLKKGFSVWAPCLHQNQCPLDFEKSKDWCHDRIHIELPESYRKLEDLLPFKNPTLTLSYCILKKQAPIKNYIDQSVRIIGDFLDEKGKSRQLICRNSEREFLTQLKRNGPPQEFQRGEIMQLPNNLTKIGNELRIS